MCEKSLQRKNKQRHWDIKQEQLILFPSKYFKNKDLFLTTVCSFVELKHGSVRTGGHKPLQGKKENVAEAMKMNTEFTHDLAQAHPNIMTSVWRKNSDYHPGNEPKKLLCQHAKASSFWKSPKSFLGRQQ